MAVGYGVIGQRLDYDCSHGGLLAAIDYVCNKPLYILLFDFPL
ncbi:hypothetical protein FORC066_2879 [Yersinia enterocolitica]|nr:hypothetical protein FORC065_1606 [Yersinia enterocolitica]UXD30087.1 hypothetical protein FORC066_2879 [Yersinia enterocolitica]